jgi:hypothetical protein
MDERYGPNINIITKGGTKTSVDAESPHEIKICKVVPENRSMNLQGRRNYLSVKQKCLDIFLVLLDL